MTNFRGIKIGNRESLNSPNSLVNVNCIILESLILYMATVAPISIKLCEESFTAPLTLPKPKLSGDCWALEMIEVSKRSKNHRHFFLMMLITATTNYFLTRSEH